MARTHRTNARVDAARKLYIDGMPPSEIALKIGISEASIWRYRWQDRKNGLDWDKMRLSQQISEDAFAEKHKQFLFALFELFEEEMKKIRELPIKERAELLDTYSSSYQRIVNSAKRYEPEIVLTDLIFKTVESIGEIAKSQQKINILSWLMENLAEIQEKTIIALKG